LVCFGFVTIFLGLADGGGGDSGGSFFSSTTIFSAARFFDSFLLLPSPSAVRWPHWHCVTYVRMCAGPDSLTSCYTYHSTASISSVAKIENMSLQRVFLQEQSQGKTKIFL